MSAIGDYIHYDIQNYKVWGVARPGKYNKPQHYNGSLINYHARQQRYNMLNSFHRYNELSHQLQKNSIANIISDQQKINLDYGQKITQFINMLIAYATKQSVPGYRGDLSKKNETQLLKEKVNFDALSKDIAYINSCLQDGKTVPRKFLEELLRKYTSLNNLGGSRTSILGKVQQGLNDYAAQAWREALFGQLGQEINNHMNKTLNVYINKELQKNLMTIGKTTIENENTVPTIKITDKVGSQYNIVATENSWELYTMQNRKNILGGSMKNIYANDPKYATFKLSGNIPLITVLNILENENRFSTHWLNRHANQLDSSLDEDLSKIIIYEAIAKNHTNQMEEDFVYIDRTIGQINYQNFGRLIEMENFNVMPNLAHKKFNNEWAPPNQPSYKGSLIRINTLLQQIHSINMRIATNSIAI